MISVCLVTSGLSLLLCILLNSCRKEQLEQPHETILVNIDNKVTISKNEFLRRAEYTIRPVYCRGNTYLHKKIILNSLIAEKFLALEASGSNSFLHNVEFQRFLKGRKEQAMRQWMHYAEATEKVKVDSSELNRYYKYAGREYKIAYYSISDSMLSDWTAQNLSQQNLNFEEVYEATYGDSSIPEKIITLENVEHIDVLQALYSDEVSIGKTLKPIRVAKDENLIIKVLQWSDTKAITDYQIKSRIQKIIEVLTRIYAAAIWENIVAQIMKGKTVDFNETVFWKVNDIFFKLYFRSNADTKNSLKEIIWDLEIDPVRTLDEIELKNILDQPFFSIDGKTWTVGEFRIALMSHPLVFRNRKMRSSEFAQQFRLAVVDLIRDIYVTRKAYERGYDNINVVVRNEIMWRDALLALHQKQNYLKTIDNNDQNSKKGYMHMIGEYLNTYVDSLQKRYYKKVQLDFDEFENITFSSIDLFVKQKGQPYQYLVPQFPVLTTDHSVEYITKMNK